MFQFILFLAININKFNIMQINPFDAFLTAPALSKNPSVSDKKIGLTIRDKIYQLFKTFPSKQICLQAVQNLGLPSYFIDLAYIQSQIQSKSSDRQLNGLYLALNCINKQISKIYRSTQIQQPSCKTQKRVFVSVNRVNTSVPAKHRQPSPDILIRRALEDQIHIRKKINDKEQKLVICQQKKNQYLQKKLQKIKSMNKRVQEVHQKQKEKLLTEGNRDSVFEQFLIKERNINIRTCANSHFMRKQMESERQKQYDGFLNNVFEKEEIISSRYRAQKHKKLMSMAQKVQERKNKLQLTKYRKQQHNKENLQAKIKSMIQKQQKIKNIRQNQLNKAISQNTSEIGKNTFQTMKNLQKTLHTINITNFGKSGAFDKATMDAYQKSLTQQNQILTKIEQKTKKKQQMIKMRVQKLKKCREMEQKRRQEHKMSEQRQLQERLKQQPGNTNESKITHIKQFIIKSDKTQQDYIKQRAQKIKQNQNTFQRIIQMRKLSYHQLQKQLYERKQRDIRLLFSKKILQILK